MKKGVLTFSGILTIIFSIILAVASVLLMGAGLNLGFVAEGTLAKFASIFSLIFVAPITSFVQVDLLNVVLPVLLLLYSIANIIFGVLQLRSKGEEDKLSKSKKINKIANVFRIIFCIFVVVAVALSFVKDEIKVAKQLIETTYGAGNLFLIVAIVVFVLGLLTAVLPSVGYKGNATGVETTQGDNQNAPQNGYYDQNGQYYENAQGYDQNGQYYDPNSGQYYNGPVHQEQYYAYNDTQPINPNDLINDQTQQGGLFNLIPGRDGIPANITQKGLEDLARLERLHASGAIDERNYLALKQKICATNVSK